MISTLYTRKLSRTRKALSSSLLVYFALKEGAIIQFTKSRISNYALKVLRGTNIRIDNKMLEMDDFIATSYRFHNQMSKIIEKIKNSQQKNIIIDIELLEKQEKEEKPISYPNISENDTRSKEAAFSNCLSYFLLSKGYKLVLGMKKIKHSIKVLQFYVWEGIITPTGNKHSVENQSCLVDLIDTVNFSLKFQSSVLIDKQSLVDSITTDSSLSVFTPVLNDYYCIINTCKKCINPFDN